MVTVALVKLWGQLVGAVAWQEEEGYASFEFDPSFLKHGLDLAPVTMPLSTLSQGSGIFNFPTISKETYYGLPGLLADSLPDRFGNRLIDIWFATQGRAPESMNPVERLCYVGNRGMGALEFEPMIKRGKNTPQPLEIDDLVKLAKEALGQKKELSADLAKEAGKALQEILLVGTSAGGARAKAIIAWNEETGKVVSGQLLAPKGFSHWIIKLDGVTNDMLGDPKGYGRIEYAYYKMAVDCGINMSESRLLQEGGRAHFMTKRFDRIENNHKLHMQTLCGLCHFDYNSPGAYAYEQVFQTMRQLRLPYSDAEQLYTRMVFNVIGRNMDDHAKNISFLMDPGGTWRLAPAYDLLYAFNPASKWLARHQMTINGKREDITRDDLLSVGKQMNIKKDKEIIDRVRSVIDRWSYYAADAGIPQKQYQPLLSRKI
ncbi:MAG: type II toxin-antitoxin system HipA family toxin [Bacteroidales bacterium]|nr:type II toxin-antitoxin system HipA family toxin [Bacteroidales bacterium]